MLSDQSLNPEVNTSDPNIGTLPETTNSDRETKSNTDTDEPPTEQAADCLTEVQE